MSKNKELQEPQMTRMPKSMKVAIQDSANKHNEGNFNRELRSLIQIGLKNRKPMAKTANENSGLHLQRVMRCASCEHKIDLVKAEKMQRYDELEHKYIKVLHCDRCGHGHDKWKVE